MPYIKKDRRLDYAEIEYIMKQHRVNDSGTLNYILTTVCNAYLKYGHTKENYWAYNDVIGALEACKLELYRRMVVPYEDKKIKENGDVY